MDDAYCKKHFIGYCPDLSKVSPYCRIEQLQDALTFAHDRVWIRDKCIQQYDKRIKELEADIVKIEANAEYHADTNDEFMGRIVELEQRLEVLTMALENTAHNIKHATPIAVCDGHCAKYECVCGDE